MNNSPLPTAAAVLIPAGLLVAFGARRLRRKYPNDDVPTWKGVALGLTAAALAIGGGYAFTALTAK